MPGGLQTTFDLLKATRNEAAADVLIHALDSPRAELRGRAFQALLARRSMAGQHELVRRWHTLDDSWKRHIGEQPGCISCAVRDAILGAEPRLRENGCEAVLVVRDYDLAPALLKAAEDPANAQASLAAGAVLALADSLYEELAAPRDYAIRRDPQLLRQYVVGLLEQSAGRFSRHLRREILEAFLVLANRDNSILKGILQNPHDAAYLPLVDVLTHGKRPGVMRLALSFLDDPHAPLSALHVVAHRADEPFLRRLLAKIGFEPGQQVRANIKRMESIGWIRDNLPLVDGLGDALQHAAVQLATGSSMNRREVYKLLARLLERGAVGGRRAAAAALVNFKGSEANQLALRALADSDPQVRAHILGQLRERGIPGAMTRLIEAVECREPVVRKAAREALAEFTFKRYLATFDVLEPEVKKSTGELVRRVDPHVLEELRAELGAPVRSRRLRAIEIAGCLGVTGDLEQAFIELLEDEDHFVRVEAALALAQSDTPTSREALREALLDRSVAVQEAAEASLRALAEKPAKGISTRPAPAAGGVPWPAVEGATP